VPVRPRTDALLTALATARRLQRPRLALRLHPGDRSASVGDRRVSLTDLEFFLLASLARRPGVTCPTEVLVREVWGDEGERRRLEVLVSRLRPRLADLGPLSIAAVPKRGYRLEPAS
jgi:DNA-binding response OmpR family regulator